jgi:hypothetical protein
MPTTRSASNAKQASSSSTIDASGEGSRSSDVGGLHDELQVRMAPRPILVGLSLSRTEGRGHLSEPSFRSATWDPESHEDPGRPTRKKSTTAGRDRSLAQRDGRVRSTKSCQVRGKEQPLAACEGEGIGARGSQVEEGNKLDLRQQVS